MAEQGVSSVEITLVIHGSGSFSVEERSCDPLIFEEAVEKPIIAHGRCVEVGRWVDIGVLR